VADTKFSDIQNVDMTETICWQHRTESWHCF